MRALAFAVAALLGALLIGFLASQPPAPVSADAPPGLFSAERAMADVRAIARAPHPTGSAENARVRAHLLARLRQMGLAAGTQSGALGEKASKRLAKWTGDEAAAPEAVNVVGLLAGRDSSGPALLMMAHYDSVWASPGAADDSAGVAAILESIRAIRSRGVAERDIIVLFTDAEELGLDGARLFFEHHPLVRRVGAVINLETRGAGGRASMFETGRGNAELVDLFRRSVPRPSGSSLAVLVYELMPNNTDFTIPKGQGTPGLNFAFIGRSELYHSPVSTPERLEQGSLQDLGQQALAAAQALAFAPALPRRGEDAVFGDVLGLFVVAYDAATGWLILAAAALLMILAWRRAGRTEPLGPRALAAAAALPLALLLHAALLLRFGNLLSGSGPDANYYDRLAAIPRLEAQAFLLCLAALLTLPLAVRPSPLLRAALPALALTVGAVLAGRFSLWLAGLAAAAAVSAMILPRTRPGIWADWFGFALPLVLLALGVQVAAPTAAPVVAWPLLLGATAMAAVAYVDVGATRWSALAIVAGISALGLGQLLYLGHFTFLGVGAPLAEAMAFFALLAAFLGWPLLKRIEMPRGLPVAALVLILAAAGIALSVRLDPMAETVPRYSLAAP